MILKEIKRALKKGRKVYWRSKSFEVVEIDKNYYIKNTTSDHTLPLTWTDNLTLVDESNTFFAEKEVISVVVTPKMFKEFKEKYEYAEENKLEQFVFMGEIYITKYGKYEIELLSSQFKDK